MRVCSPVVRKLPGDKRELQIQVLASSDLKLISVKYSLEEWPVQLGGQGPTPYQSKGMHFPGKPPNHWQIDQLSHVTQAWEGGWSTRPVLGELPLLGPFLWNETHWKAYIQPVCYNHHVKWCTSASVPLIPSWRPPHRQPPTRTGESWEADIRHLQSRTHFLLSCNSSTKLGRFSACVAVETDTFPQQVPEKHHFQVEKLVLDCMGWIQY